MSTQSTDHSTPSFITNDSYTVQASSEISLICHDRHLRDTVFLDSAGNTLFALDVASPLKSWTLRRTLRDAAGAVVLQVRHSKKSTGLEHWYVEDARGKRLCEAKGGKTAREQATRIEATVLAGVEAGRSVVLQSVDSAGSSTVFEVGGRRVAEMVLTANNNMAFLGRRGLDRSVWKIKVEEGADLALIAALAICRVEVLHAWKR